MPFSGPYSCRIADRRLEILSMRKLRATYLKLWTGRRIQKPEVVSKMSEIVRNVKFTVIRNCVKKIIAAFDDIEICMI